MASRAYMQEHPAGRASDYNYLLLSDVHLGAGLVSHARPWANNFREECTAVDRALATCLAHYDSARPLGKPWRLVVAGDFIDFIGMSLPPPESELPSGVTTEERRHGLGNAADHAVEKLRAAAGWHHAAFAALARFVASGNELILVRGNHDVDFHWKPVQRAFIDLLHQHGPSHMRRAEYRTRTSFCPWFYRAGQLLYVEHGHEFDAMCSYGDPLSPVCPSDHRRIRLTPSDVMLRYVARPTPGLSTTIAEQGSTAAYLKLAASLGVTGGLRLVARFVRACYRLLRESIRHRRRHSATEAQRLGRMRGYGRRFRMPAELMQALGALHVTPAHAVPGVLMARLYLDRMAMLSLSAACAIVAVSVTTQATWSLTFGGFALALAAAGGWGQARGHDPVEELRRGAEKVARVLPIKYVVMGHTHHPTIEPVGDGARYINLGHWGQDDLPEDRPTGHRAPCSHLVLLTEAERVTAELRSWHPEDGAQPLYPAHATTVLRSPPTPAQW